MPVAPGAFRLAEKRAMSPFKLAFWRNWRRPPAPRFDTETGPLEGPRAALVCTRDSKTSGELCAILGKRGYATEVHRNPWAARYSARRNLPDLAVIDWHLGDISAAKLTSTLCSANGGRTCSILALVPANKSSSLVTILELGAHDFVMTPVDPALLATRLSLIEARYRELEQMRARQEGLNQEYQRLLIATGGLGDGLWDLDLSTETVHFSDRWKDMLGYAPDEIEDNLESWLNRVHAEDLTRLRAIIDASIAGEVSVIEQRYRMMTKGGDYRWMLTRGEVVKDADDRAIRVVGRQTDVHGEDESREAMRTSGLQDPLTRLPNRAVLMDRLRHAFARAERDAEQGFAVLFFDLDRFKNVNDSLGHLHGDQLLRAIAERVENACRPAATM